MGRKRCNDFAASIIKQEISAIEVRRTSQKAPWTSLSVVPALGNKQNSNIN
jgi:hypothetical protein